MKNLVYFLVGIVFFTGLIGCEVDDSISSRKVVGIGPVVSSTLDLSSFTGIENTGVADIYVTLGTPQSVVFKAQQNIMDVMTTEVRSNTFRIGVDKDVSIENTEEIRFDITIPSIEKIELIGVGKYVLSGDYQDELIIILTGVGHVDAFDLEVGTCDITSTGVGNCEVNVVDELNVTLSGVGMVYYKGDPTINSTVTGLGSLVDSN